MLHGRTLPVTVMTMLLVGTLQAQMGPGLVGEGAGTPRPPRERAQQQLRSYRIRLKTFPDHARVTISPSPAVPPQRRGAWRDFDAVPYGARVTISAPGYRTHVVHVVPKERAWETQQDEATLVIEERLQPTAGPLNLIGERATGASPKSVAFLPDNRMVVPLLGGPGADVFRVYEDEGGSPHVERVGRIAPPPRYAREHGFVETLVSVERGELWLSQMTTDRLHRFDLADLEYIDSITSGGRWPKVMATVGDGAVLAVSNWLTHDVSLHGLDADSGARRVEVGETPRGMAVGPEGTLWVCLFGTGDIVTLDVRSGRVTGRLGLGPGAARHIITQTDGRWLYYTDMHRGTVGKIDAVTGGVTVSRRVGINLNTIVLSSDGRFLVVSERGRNHHESYLRPGPEFGRLIVLDAADLEPLHEVWGRRQPTGLSISDDGRFLAATDFLDDNLAVYRLELPNAPHARSRGSGLRGRTRS